MDNYSPLCTQSLAADDQKIINENHGWDFRQKFLCSPRLTENEIPVGIIKGERRNRIRDDPRALIEREKSKKTYWISSNTFEEIIIDVIDEKGG